MELLLTMTILLVLIVLVGNLIMTNETSEESAKATHEPMKYSLSQVRLAIGHIGKVPPRARLPNVG